MRWIARILLLLLLAGSLLILWRGKGSAVQERNEIDAPASRAHPAGTDDLGRDRLERNAEALVLCMSLAAGAALVATGIAAGVALLAAYLRRPYSTVVYLLSDSLLAVPGLFLLMLVRASLPLDLHPGTTAVLTFGVIAILNWPLMVRTIAAEIQRHRSSAWMRYCYASGIPPRTIFGRHMLVQLRPLLVAHFLLTLPAFVVAEANLGVLGLGVPDPLASWGGMLSELAQSYLRGGSAWRYLPAALLVFVLVLLELAGLDRSERGEAREQTAREVKDRGERLETALS
ncbi:MAG: ABC transporter permease [Acidobacteriota bacterium]